MPAQLVDTHCHLNFHRYAQDRNAVLRRAHAAGVTRVIAPAIDLATCAEVLRLAETHEGVFAAVGVHPNSAKDFDSADINKLRQFAAHPKVVAIGEIGLDYHWDRSPKSAQIRAFAQQLDLAGELELPVIIHSRDASQDVLEILAAWAAAAPASLSGRLGVLHSFSASRAIAERALELGFYLGFTGPLTFKRAADLREVAATVPLDRLLVETDAPFLAPAPKRGKRNEPAWVRYTNARLADLHGMSAEAMARQTTRNAEALFKLSHSDKAC